MQFKNIWNNFKGSYYWNIPLTLGDAGLKKNFPSFVVEEESGGRLKKAS
jgi:hypothetical protein